METQGMTKGFFSDAGDGAMAHFQLEFQQLKRSTKRFEKILAGLLVLLGVAVIVLIGVVGVQGHKIRHLQNRQGLIPHQNVTFASYSGDQEVEGLTYGGSLFRGSGFWSSRNALPGKLTDHAAIGVGDQVYIIGGADEFGNATDQTWLYDSIFHNYTLLQPMPTPRYRFGAALDTISNKIYVVGGRANDTGPEGCLLSTFILDLETHNWTIGASSLECQSDTCAASLFGKVYMFGGYDAEYGYLSKTEVYNPEDDSWRYGPDVPTPRGDAMCAAFDGELYVIGGYVDGGENDGNSFSAAVESLEPNETTWTTQPSLLTPRGDAAVAVLPGDKLLVVGGEGHYKNETNFKYPKHVNEVYYGADRTWVEKAMIPTARFRSAAATAGGLAFVFGGADVCILSNDTGICPSLDTSEVYLDVDHPHVYVYLKDDSYNDNAGLTTYPV